MKQPTPARTAPEAIPSHAPVPGRDPGGGSAAARPLAAAGLLLLAAAIGLRLVHLGNVPGVNGDEAWYGVLALKVAAGDAPAWWTPTGNLVNPFYLAPLVLLHLAVAPSVVALRSVAVASGVLALAVNFILCRRVYGGRTAAISTMLLAVLPINIAYSRFGWDSSQSLLATVPVVYCSLAAARGGAGAWGRLVAAAVALGAALVVHPTNVFVAPFVLIAGARLSWPGGVPARFAALRRPARPMLYAALASAALALAWLGQRWLVVAAGRALDLQQVFEFANRLQRLFTGVTVYQFIPGTFAGPSLTPGESAALAAHDLAGLAILGAAVSFLANRARGTRDARDSTLLLACGASLAGFYLIAGPDAIAPHWERYGIGLIAPVTVVLARSASTWLPPAAGAGRTAVLLAVGWVVVASFTWNYFRAFRTSGGRSHQTFRTGTAEPKAAAIDYIASRRSGGGTDWIVTTTWWTYWPLAYLAGGLEGMPVLRTDDAWTNPAVVAAAGTGRVWVVEFTGSEEAAAGRAALKAASMSAAVAESPQARLQNMFTLDYSGRAVLSVFRAAPPVR